MWQRRSGSSEHPDQLPLTTARQRDLYCTSCSIQWQRYEKGIKVGTHPRTLVARGTLSPEFHTRKNRKTRGANSLDSDKEEEPQTSWDIILQSWMGT
jgi:hypothetical protein